MYPLIISKTPSHFLPWILSFHGHLSQLDYVPVKSYAAVTGALIVWVNIISSSSSLR